MPEENKLEDAGKPESAGGKTADKSAPVTGLKGKKKSSWGKRLLFIILGIVVLRMLLSIPMNIRRGPEASYRLTIPAEPVVYNGPGELQAFAETEIPLGSTVQKHNRFKSNILHQERDVFVYLPKGYSKDAPPLPLMIVFHGYLDRPQHLLGYFMSAFDEAEGAGRTQPVVMVFPDISIGGTGEDDPKTPNLDERMGSWGVNSNVGRYEDFLVDELIPWVRENYNVRRDAEGTILAGYSAGGAVALNKILKMPGLSRTAVVISGTIDARYSIDGVRMRPFNKKGYKAIAKDDPDRPVLRAGLLGTYTDRWAYYVVFDSDKTPGPVWKQNLPVWQRVRNENPMDLARNTALDLSGRAFYLVAGARDNYGFQHHLPLFIEALKLRGAAVAPENNVRPGLHNAKFIKEQLPDIATWLGKRLRELPAGDPQAADPPVDSSPTSAADQE